MAKSDPTNRRVVRLPTAGVFSQLNVRLPAELGRQVRALSAQSGRNLGTIVIEALQQYLDQQRSFRQSG